MWRRRRPPLTCSEETMTNILTDATTQPAFCLIGGLSTNPPKVSDLML